MVTPGNPLSVAHSSHRIARAGKRWEVPHSQLHPLLKAPMWMNSEWKPPIVFVENKKAGCFL